VKWGFLALLWLVALAVAVLHLAAALKEARRDRPSPVDGDGLVFLGTFADLPEGRAAIVHVDGERVAVVRKNDALWAISNVCPHQNGPFGEGRVRDGYLECPSRAQGRADIPQDVRVAPSSGRRMRRPRPFHSPRKTCPGSDGGERLRA
jgi:hypothetical protein